MVLAKLRREMMCIKRLGNVDLSASFCEMAAVQAALQLMLAGRAVGGRFIAGAECGPAIVRAARALRKHTARGPRGREQGAEYNCAKDAPQAPCRQPRGDLPSGEISRVVHGYVPVACGAFSAPAGTWRSQRPQGTKLGLMP
jgi:hypothetical protein